MRLLLDTHVLLWTLALPKLLPKNVEKMLVDPSNVIFVSAASTWEIAIKSALGKLDADIDEIVGAISTVGFEELPITLKHTRRVRALPAHHRDPFDRLLVAQAIEDGMSVVTRDSSLAVYGVPIEWG